MANLRILALIATGLLGCGGEDDEISCSSDERSGTYLSTFTEQSGNCGPIPEQLGRLDDAEALPDTCALDAEDRWSEAECKLERAFTCEEPGVGEGVTAAYVAVTEQTDEDGGSLTGTLTVTVFEPDGSVMCKSTYRTTIERQ
jgi:hypothetical protein